MTATPRTGNDSTMTAADLRAWRAHWLIRSQQDLANLLGVHLATVSRWERGVDVCPAWLPLALETLARRRAADLNARTAALS